MATKWTWSGVRGACVCGAGYTRTTRNRMSGHCDKLNEEIVKTVQSRVSIFLLAEDDSACIYLYMFANSSKISPN
jgi:hypothetical protein